MHSQISSVKFASQNQKFSKVEDLYNENSVTFHLVIQTLAIEIWVVVSSIALINSAYVNNFFQSSFLNQSTTEVLSNVP